MTEVTKHACMPDTYTCAERCHLAQFERGGYWGCSSINGESPGQAETSQAEVATHHRKLDTCCWPPRQGSGADDASSSGVPMAELGHMYLMSTGSGYSQSCCCKMRG